MGGGLRAGGCGKRAPCPRGISRPVATRARRLRAVWAGSVAALLLAAPAGAQGVGIGPLCDGKVALDSASPSLLALGETSVVVRSLVGWPVRFRQAPASAPPPPEEPAAPRDGAPSPAGRGVGAMPPGAAFEVPPDLLDRALTERLFPGRRAGADAPAAAPPPPVARPPQPWRWLLPGEAVTLRVAPGSGGLLARLGLQCDGGLLPPPPLAAPPSPR